MLQTKDLSFAYDSKKEINFPDLACEGGEAILILGPSGCGKTTLLHLLAGFLTPKKGSIHLNGKDFNSFSTSQMDQFRGKNIGIIFQRSHFIQSLNVADNLLIAQYLADVLQDKARIRRALEKVNVVEKYSDMPNRLSQGEQQRVSIARALINNPQLILADEPTASLDDENCHEVANHLRTQAIDAQASLVIVTHDHRLKEYFPTHVELVKGKES